jgi:hypothetical protein
MSKLYPATHVLRWTRLIPRLAAMSAVGSGGCSNDGGSSPQEPSVSPFLDRTGRSDSEAIESSLRRWYEQLIEPALQAAVASDQALERANDLCERQQSFVEAETAMLWQRCAESVLAEDLLFANGLDRGSV